MNYRKLYERHYGIKIPPDYDIHHINFNHEDNRVENLILLPKKLHQRIHKCFMHNGCIRTDELFMFKCCANQLVDSMLSSALQEASEIYNDIQIWASCKEMEDIRIHAKQDVNTPMYFSYRQFRK